MSTLENWTVVKFTEDETIEAITTKWLMNYVKCVILIGKRSYYQLYLWFQFDPEKY